MLFFFITRKLSKFKFDNSYTPSSRQQNIEITVPTFILHQLLKKTLITVGTGILLLLIVLVIASKFKIILLLLPISFYLIGQFFVFNNHSKIIRNQKAVFNPSTNILTLNTSNNKTLALNLSTDAIQLKEVKSVQKNNGLLMGYFQLTTAQGTCFIPYLLAANEQNIPLFNKLDRFHRIIETKIFPII